MPNGQYSSVIHHHRGLRLLWYKESDLYLISWFSQIYLKAEEALVSIPYDDYLILQLGNLMILS